MHWSVLSFTWGFCVCFLHLLVVTLRFVFRLLNNKIIIIIIAVVAFVFPVLNHHTVILELATFDTECLRVKRKESERG
jgi:hypothetical protein